ncbi:MAG: FmdB family transcriptional regulator [Actinomycetia bacterium]|nr:FmdB family transcriptional regulator [Actinomycetes bacterium]
MPTYQYRCQTCEGEFELRQSFTDDALTTCIDVECHGPVNKVFSGVGIAFKGDGFYKNDHGSSAGGHSSEKALSTSNSSDSASEGSGSSNGTSSDASSSGGDSSGTKDASSVSSTSDAASTPSANKASSGSASGSKTPSAT